MPIISSFPDFQLSLEVTEFGFKSEFFLRITHLHKIAHTQVEFESKIEPINSILRVLWLKTFMTIIFDHTVVLQFSCFPQNPSSYSIYRLLALLFEGFPNLPISSHTKSDVSFCSFFQFLVRQQKILQELEKTKNIRILRSISLKFE